MSSSDLSALSRGAGSGNVLASRPRSRLLTRALLPAVVVLGTLVALAYAARESLRPALVVRVVPVVPYTGGERGGRSAFMGEIVQAPGWIEAEPYAVSVAALTQGVVKELTVLEGDRVAAGQVVARLVSEDAMLVRKRASAEVERMEAAVREARAAVAVEQALVAEAKESLDRIEPLAGSGTVAEGEIVQRRLKVASRHAAEEASRSAVAKAESEVAAARVMLEDAELALSRTEVRAPCAGVVLVRLVEPGQRLMLDANNMFAGVVVRLYDPARLQVRVDVPLADAAKVHEGDSVEVTTETMGTRVFHAKVTRFVHEANLQKNTVQVKAAIADPAAELKPEMLAKVRIQSAAAPSTGGPKGGAGTEVLLARKDTVVEASGNEASVWVIDQPSSTVHKRRVQVGGVVGEAVEVLEGLRPGDRLVVSPSAEVREGVKVKAIEIQEGH